MVTINAHSHASQLGAVRVHLQQARMRQGLETRAEIRSGITLAAATDRGAPSSRSTFTVSTPTKIYYEKGIALAGRLKSKSESRVE